MLQYSTNCVQCFEKNSKYATSIHAVNCGNGVSRLGMGHEMEYSILSLSKSLCGLTYIVCVHTAYVCRCKSLLYNSLALFHAYCKSSLYYVLGQHLHVQAVLPLWYSFVYQNYRQKRQRRSCTVVFTLIHYCNICRVLTCSGCEYCCSLAGLPCLRAPALEIEHNHSIIIHRRKS